MLEIYKYAFLSLPLQLFSSSLRKDFPIPVAFLTVINTEKFSV